MTIESNIPENLRRSRAQSDEMLEWLRGRGKTIIIHGNPDPDCLASAMEIVNNGVYIFHFMKNVDVIQQIHEKTEGRMYLPSDQRKNRGASLVSFSAPLDCYIDQNTGE
jgi:hypothetical protein